MANGITRRDFMNGIAIAVAGAAGIDLSGARAADASAVETYPLTGRYDLVVIGAGISGLSAAHFYRQRRPKARVLILDTNDDFGGRFLQERNVRRRPPGAPALRHLAGIGRESARQSSAACVSRLFPLGEKARAQLFEMYWSDRDVLSGKSPKQRLAVLEHTSYRDFIKQYWDADEEILKFLQTRTGRIAIANSDSGWDAYTHVAINEAHRAVRELIV